MLCPDSFGNRIDKRIADAHTGDMTTTAKSPARIKLEAAIAAKDTATLLSAHGILEAKATMLPEERLTMALIADCIEARHNLSDAMDAIFEDEDYAGTYHEALLIALVATGCAA